jgi:hypothetical protein
MRLSPSATLYCDVLCDPASILAGLEVLRCARLLGVRLTTDITAAIAPLLEIDNDGIRSDRRVARLWSTALEIVGSDAMERHRGRAAALTNALEQIPSDHVMTQECLDYAVTAVSLYTTVGAPKSILATFGEQLDAAVADDDALAAAVLLAHGVKCLREMPPNRVDGWLEFLSSMMPRSLPYGWLSVSADPDMIVAYETAAGVATLALRAAGYEVSKGTSAATSCDAKADSFVF